MVLQKVGEFLTTINVNGTERVSELQSGDRTFNISEVFNTSVSVNGSHEGSFNQNSDNNYDVDVSASTTFPSNMSISRSHSGWTNDSVTGDYSIIQYQCKNWESIDFTASYNNNDHWRTWVEVDGNNVTGYDTSGVTYSGTANNYVAIRKNDSNAEEIEATIDGTVSVDTQTSINVNGVSQQ